MIKIGDFSKLAHVSIKTLHHYDALGLFQPVHVDRYSGYRYYEIGQLSCLNRILALKDLGLSLEQVTELLHADLSTAEMRGMLRLKQMELVTAVEEQQARLQRVEQRLRQLEMDGAPLHSEIALKDIPAQTALVAQVVAASEQILWPARASLQALLTDTSDSSVVGQVNGTVPASAGQFQLDEAGIAQWDATFTSTAPVGRLLQVLRVLTSLAMSMKYSSHDGRIGHYLSFCQVAVIE